jgi:hypothetical protein
VFEIDVSPGNMAAGDWRAIHMHVDAGDALAGQPILEIRGFFRRAGSGWDASYLRQALGLDDEEAGRVLDELVRRRYVEPDPRDPKRWNLTRKACRLALASAARPVRRATAQRALEQFLERVEAVNTDDCFAYRVTRVVVFGSFLTDRERLGDLDLAVELQPRHPDPDVHNLHCGQRIDEALAKGRQFGNIVAQLYWPQHEVLLILKARSRTISLHTIADAVLKRTKTKVVYQYGPGGA